MVRVGGGTERLDNYLIKNQPKFQKYLVNLMNSCQESLETVVDKLIRGEKIKKLDPYAQF